MAQIYFRPLAFSYGADARRLIERGLAGRLGGMAHIGFSHVELIERNGKSRPIVPYAEVCAEAAVLRLTAVRPSFGGLAMDECRVMGIVNVTPDSFSDGGRFNSSQSAIAHGRQLAEEGADILDVGGESTRPGSDPVSEEEELARVLPVIETLATDHLVSVDTRKALVMRRALAVGARIVNDVSSLSFDPASTDVVNEAGVPVILMHAQGQPKTMQLNPKYDDVLLDVYDSLQARIEAAVAAGIKRDNICVDPGIGFGKSFKQNLELLAGLGLFHGLGVPVMVGLSRKAFIGAISGEKVAGDRVHGSVGGAMQAVAQGVHILRVHDVKATVQAIKVFTASADPDSADL